MLATYTDLFRTRGALAFSGAGFLARMQMSMLGIGMVLMISGVTGTYGIAGAVAGSVAFAGAVAMPQLARTVDRLGQARVLRPALLVHGLFIAMVILAVRADWPVWTWFLFGMLAGAGLPSIGSMVRARWAYALVDRGRRQTAFALESVLDEVIFVVGPPLATFLATSVSPEAGLVAAVTFALGGGLLFAARRDTEPPPQLSGSSVRRRDVLSRGVLIVTAVFTCAGAVFGSVEVIVVAFADERGVKPLAGVVLACYAAGSLIAGLVYGARAWRQPLPNRFLIAVAIFSAATILPLAAPSVATLAVLIFVTGLGIAPVIIAGMTLVERLVPKGALTEGLTWSTTALTIGVTIGAALAGPIIDHYGARTAFRLPTAAALLAAIVAASCLRGLRRAYDRRPRHEAEDVSDIEPIAGTEAAAPAPHLEPLPGRMDP